MNEFASAMAVALEAQRLVELRDRWLNPPEWVEWVDETEIPLAANGQAAQFIHEIFPGTDTSDSSWGRCAARCLEGPGPLLLARVSGRLGSDSHPAPESSLFPENVC